MPEPTSRATPSFPRNVLELRPTLPHYTRVSCRESARSKGIPVHEELKSILFQSAEMIAMAHVPGDYFVDERALSAVVGHVQLMAEAELRRCGLEKGRVNPFTAERYLGARCVHVICPSVFDNEYVNTNNDRVGGWVRFRPQYILHWVNRVRVHPIAIATRTR